jgi:predicted DNA-binding protein
MNKFEESADALESRDWSSAYLDDRPRTATIVQSVRMPRELTERLFAEAQRRGVTPSEVIRDLVEAGLSAAEESATVRLADVHRVINSLARHAA